MALMRFSTAEPDVGDDVYVDHSVFGDGVGGGWCRRPCPQVWGVRGAVAGEPVAPSVARGLASTSSQCQHGCSVARTSKSPSLTLREALRSAPSASVNPHWVGLAPACAVELGFGMRVEAQEAAEPRSGGVAVLRICGDAVHHDPAPPPVLLRSHKLYPQRVHMASQRWRSAPIEELRFVDFCAGLGGFHLGLGRATAEVAQGCAPKRWKFKCVMAADIEDRLRQVYPRNFPEIAQTYAEYFPPERCAETPGLGDIYDHDGVLARVHGDLEHLVDVERDTLKCWPGTVEPIVPAHDLLCAGFPCQPFSKSGAQLGFKDLKGTVFRMLAVIIARHRPRFVFLENVGNFERHDGGNTWKIVRQTLEDMGYSVRATTTVGGADGGLGLLSPHHLGLPQHRERFFIVAQRKDEVGAFHEDSYPFPLSFRSHVAPEARLAQLNLASETALKAVIARTQTEASPEALAAAQLSNDRKHCVNHWRELLLKIEAHDRQSPATAFRPLPSFPIWGFELDPWHHYPAAENPRPLADRPSSLAQYRRNLVEKLVADLGDYGPRGDRSYLASSEPSAEQLARWVNSWPQYARSRDSWPRWKVRFIEQNREWALLLWTRLDPSWLRDWLDELATFPASHQKLEWNCKGEDLDLWNHILQFRPSGLRVKRFRHIPALVAMTMTQVPVVPVPGAKGEARHLLASEALELQGFPRTWEVPATKGGTFTALGNAVHVDLVAAIARTWLFEESGPYDSMGTLLSSNVHVSVDDEPPGADGGLQELAHHERPAAKIAAGMT